MKLMKVRQFAVAGLGALLMSSALLTGCSGAATSAGSAAGSAAVTEAAGSSDSGATRTVKDTDGNEVTIPAKVTKVAPTIGAFAQVTEMLTNGNGKIVAAATKQVDDNFKSVFSDEQLQQLKDAGVTFVNVAAMKTPDEICTSIQTIGDILGKDESARAKEFVKYYKKQIKNAEDRAKKVSDDKKVTMIELSVEGGQYFVAPSTDISSQYMEAAGVTNLAADYTSDTKSTNGSLMAVSAEQIAAWNPDYIMCFNQATKDAIIKDKAFSKLTSMSDGGSSNFDKVFVCPKGLYLWSVRSAEGCLLPEFIGQYVYPEQYEDFSMQDTLKSFYKDWYNTKLSTHDAESILTGATNSTVAGSKK